MDVRERTGALDGEARNGEARSGVERLEVGEAAEAYLAALTAQGVECLFLNPGTDTFPIQTATATLQVRGRLVCASCSARSKSSRWRRRTATTTSRGRVIAFGRVKAPPA